MTSEERKRVERRNRLAAKLIEEAWKVVRASKGLPVQTIPVGGLEASLLAIDAELGVAAAGEERGLPAGSFPYRVLRGGLEVGRAYVLVREGMEPLEFKFLGDGMGEGVVRGFGVEVRRRMRMLVGGIEEQEMFYADAGLEPHSMGSPGEWWGKSWVRKAQLDESDVEDILAGMGDEEGVSVPDELNPLYLPGDPH